MLRRLAQPGLRTRICSKRRIPPGETTFAAAWPMRSASSTSPKLPLPSLDSTMNRKFFALLAFVALSIAIGGMACIETQETIDDSDETDGAT